LKALTLIFVVLIALLQYPLWLGKGSWLRVWDLSHQISKQQEKNNALKARNDTLDAEVRDLKQGYAAIEERARSELGMVKQDEVFYQVLEGPMPVVEPPPSLPKSDTPIIVPVPSKSSSDTAQDGKAKNVKPSSEAKPKDSRPKDNGLAKDNGLKDKTAQEKSAPAAVSPLTQEPAAVKSTEEKPKAEKPKSVEKAKKSQPEGDALDDARAVLKQ
jgi:cell division protein FtsB